MRTNIYAYQYLQYIVEALQKKHDEIMRLSHKFEPVTYTLEALHANGNPVRDYMDGGLVNAVNEYNELEMQAVCAFGEASKYSNQHASMLAHWSRRKFSGDIILTSTTKHIPRRWTVELTSCHENDSYIDSPIFEEFEQYEDARKLFNELIEKDAQGQNNPPPELTEAFIENFARSGEHRFFYAGGSGKERGEHVANYAYMGLHISIISKGDTIVETDYI